MPKTVQLQDCPSVTDANWNFWLDHFKRLLLEKRQELLDSTGEAGIRVPAAGASLGDSVEEANADAEAELQIRLHQTDGPLVRAIEYTLGRIRQGTYGVRRLRGTHIRYQVGSGCPSPKLLTNPNDIVCA